eukprot:372738_1
MTQGSAHFKGLTALEGGPTTLGSSLAPPRPTHGTTISTIKLIPIGELNKKDMNWMRSMDPELRRLGKIDEHAGDTVPDMTVLPRVEEETKWREYMENLEKYALLQKKIYESHPMSQDKPLYMITQEEMKDDRDTAWMQCTQNIHQFLDERRTM